MFCIYCGNQCSDSAKFCAKCGKPIVRMPVDEAEEKEPEEIVATEAEEKEPEETVAAEATEKKPEETVAAEAEEKEPEAVAAEAPLQEPETEAVQETLLQEPNAAATEETLAQKTEKPAKKVKKVKKETTGGKIAAHFFSVIWTVLLIALSLVLLLKITCDGILGDFNTSGILDAVELKEVPVGEIVGSLGIDGVDIEDDDNLSDVVYELIQTETELDVTKSQVDDLLDKLEVNDFLNELKDEYLQVVTGEKTSAYVKPAQIMKFIEDNKRVLEKSLDIEIEDSDLETIKNSLEDMDIEEVTTVRMSAGDNEVIQKIQMVFQYSMALTILLAICMVVLAGLLFLTNLRKKRRAVLYIGAGVIIAAGAGYVSAKLVGKLLSMLSVPLDKATLDTLLAGVSALLTRNSLVFLAAGAAILVVFIVCEVVARVRNHHQTA